jgi:Na+/glutamate symporter
MAKGKRRKERLRAMKLALAGSDVTMDGGGGGGGATTTTIQPVGADVGVTAAAGATFSGDVFASTLAGLLSTKEAGETTMTQTTQTTHTSSSLSSRHAKAPPTMRRAIAKRKRLALDKALAHAERRGAKRDKKSLKRGNRVAARDVY